MSGEVKTYSINDERINVESEIEIAIKNSIQSGIVQKYQQLTLHWRMHLLRPIMQNLRLILLTT